MTQIPYLDQTKRPHQEPITIEDVRVELLRNGVTSHPEESEYLTSLIKMATRTAEEYLKRSLITQTWQLQYDLYVPQKLPLPKGPVQFINHVKIIRQNWSEGMLDKNIYWIHSAKDQLVFDVIPMGLIIQIEYTTGYGNRKDVPVDIRQGILAHVVLAYQSRDSEEGLPKMAQDLYAPFKLVRI